MAFASDLSGHPQVHWIGGPGQWPRRVIPTPDRMLPVAGTPRGLLVRHDRGGNETWQLSLLESGGLRALTHDDRAIHHAAALSPAGTMLGMAYNPGGQVDFVLASLDLQTRAIDDWLRPKGMWRWTGWQPDGRRAAVAYLASPTRVEGSLLERGGRPLRLLPQARRLTDLSWSPRGGLYGITDLSSQFLALAELDPSTPDRVRRWLSPRDADVLGFVLNHAGTQAAVIINDGPFDRVQIIELDSGRVLERLPMPEGTVFTDMTSDSADHLAWSQDDATLFMAWETPNQPADIYSYPGGTRWTFAGEAAHDPLRLEQTSYRSFDGLRIPALLYRVDDRPRPTVVYFHGGPESQMRGNYLPLFHLLHAAGMNVFAPNVRGSTGYGIDYFSLDDKALRWNAVRDGCEAARYLRQSGIATTVGVMGRSYGGFMTLAVLVEAPELWDAAVEFVGIADWHTFFQNTSPWRRAMRAAEYGDPDGAEAEVLREISPLRQAHKIKTPLLIIHGRNDVRVPVGEAEQIARTARETELMVFEDEGHGIIRHSNMVRAYGRSVTFLGERLLD